MYLLVNKNYDVNDIDLLILQYGLYIILLTYIETDFLIEDYSWICGCLFSWISGTYQFQGFVWVFTVEKAVDLLDWQVVPHLCQSAA